MNITEYDIRDMGLMKYFRVIRKWACANWNVSMPDFEFLMTLHHLRRFTRKQFEENLLLYAWDDKRWSRFLNDGWIVKYRDVDMSKRQGAKYKATRKLDGMMNKVYRIMLGKEDIPVTHQNPFYRGDTYTKNKMNVAIDILNKDESRKWQT